ncbi:midasin-like isoform X2 [Rhododendron vialii]|uniref:midasin-like isoform X2 n=1 Tax=Rhododendron vialii TaxID=182163 RepID=UPI00265DD3F0|nr:midasin-like isoform X2 [Rhododendron vialii]
MAIYQSSRLEFELERFLSRCPKLSSVSRLNSLLQQGHSLTEEEMVNSLAELFLNPNYTIPLLGCFRFIAQKIVDRAVALLRLVPDLTLDSDVPMVESPKNEILGETGNLDDGVGVIDVYIRSGRTLVLHELACLALCRALDLAPFLLGSVLSYFKFAPPPFERIMQRKYISELSVKTGTQYLLNVIRASYRLLLTRPEVFAALWDWYCFLDLVPQAADLEPGDDAKLYENVSDMKWCGIQILSVVLKISDRATNNVGLGPKDAFACLLRWQEFCQDVSLEKAGWYIEPLLHEGSPSFDGNLAVSQENRLWTSTSAFAAPSSSMFLDLEPSHWNRRSASRIVTSTRHPFILTSTMKKSFEMVQLSVDQKWPVLLYGPPGAGKTKLINELAWDSGSPVLSIHMDEQIDGKTLIGSYICSEKPGEFRWQPGSLTQAIINGLWFVFEDIDKAPSDVQSILLPLLEGASSFLTGHGEVIRVAESFRLFATVSSSKFHISQATEVGRSAVGALWRRVMIGPPCGDDLRSIVKARYPDLESLAERLIETFERVNQLTRFQFGISAASCTLSRFSLRDLMKWCKRIDALGFSVSGDDLPTYVCSCIYQEAVDVFASFTTSVDNRLNIMKCIAKMWALPMSASETLYPVNKPLIQELHSDLRIGRISLQCAEKAFHYERKPFVEIRSAIHVLERIACSVKLSEPVLLVGETGTGKTTLVQSLALRLGQKLTVLNLSQQSDVADLLGGFKPMNAQFVCIPLYKEFDNLFTSTFPKKDNEDFLFHLKKFVSDKNWKMLLRGFQKGVRKILETPRYGPGTKRKRPLGEELLKAWEDFSLKLETARAQINDSAGMMFSFVEGAFVTALRNGEWILLDEVSLAPPETLQRVIGVLEDENSSLCLAERGDIDYVHRHPNFRLFACMNPATDAGKRDLPYSLRSRFTEYFVDDVLDDEDLVMFINQFMDDGHSDVETVKQIVRFYKAAKKESEERLQDGANQKPQYSLRSLYRALEYTKKARRKFGFLKALYDGFCMFFLTLLDGASAKIMNQMISSVLLGGNIPPQVPFNTYLIVGDKSRLDNLSANYVLTTSVKEHLKNLARAIVVGRYPVLLQGPTSSGKTSLVQYLAEITGHEFVRINNHEHTDLQEYIGSYITDAGGRLTFHEGVLVKAVRKGYWIVLDELNLAPSDVLEALNRLLDDNRELFIPELHETIRAHPGFMLFATQNPPTFYGGRKMLSRAFRNRFVEVHVDEIPEGELSEILEKRCKIPESYAKKMVEVMKELQFRRQSSKVFAGKHGFITPRDLFRWANRFRTFGNSYEDLARDGYFLLAERLRDESEKIVVQEVLERQLRVKLTTESLYQKDPAVRDKILSLRYGSENIALTESMWRLHFLIERCYKMREPVLLVGETGGGKTTVCQLLSIMLGSTLHILNCHQYTETSDFLGGFFPVRERSIIASEFKNLCKQVMLSKAFVYFPGAAKISADIGEASTTIDQLDVVINSYREGLVSHPEVTLEDLDSIENLKLYLSQLQQKWQTIFMWQDGPLVQAMKNGDLLLVDEISLADDSVLERLNSVLEPERKLSLAEKGGLDLEKLTAHPDFMILATMNPGGDYGKKELSPALRNRFTEIWVPPVNDLKELRTIALQRISEPGRSYVVDSMLNFWQWFNQLQTGRTLTVRDLLSWLAFIDATMGNLPPEDALIHGAFLVLLDGISLGSGISKGHAGELRERCMSFLLEQLKMSSSSLDCSNLSVMANYGWSDVRSSADSSCDDNMQCDNLFGIHPFYIANGDDVVEKGQFEFVAPTTNRNTLRVLRALQLPKPVLLEGSPGVGKTSLIEAIGKFSGHAVVRINLSEQTDIMDLLGSDLPVDSDEGMQFAWHDGILLQALKKGSWVLLDELNLAPQSVLEGLNAILDHRAEVFIPELGVTFKCSPSFRIFACQNPPAQGGGRKGLSKSFLNRFLKVYVDELTDGDYEFICRSLYPSIPESLLRRLILFNKRLHEDTMLHLKFAQEGSPWEFNLRDVIRSCQIIQGAPEGSKHDCFLNVIYVLRMRTTADRRKVVQLYEEVFGRKAVLNPYPCVQLNPRYLVVGNTCIDRNRYQSSKSSNSELKILPGLRHSLEAAALCVQHEWLSILVGPSSSGKTSLIRLLAQLTGNVLNEISLSSASDITDLLGSFEQYNAFRHFQLAIARVEFYVSEYCSLQLESSGMEFPKRRKELMTRWLAFLSSIGCGPTTSPTLNTDHWRARTFGSVPLFVEIIENLKSDLAANRLPISWSCKDLDRTLKTITKLHRDYQRRAFSAKFEWVTGVLVKAIANGEWIVLENANLCNPTVLDRINSLVEPHGSITVNECGSVDGKPLVLHPHPKFRMFLTVDPRYGEVSRAMRNRGVEIYMMQPCWMLDGGSSDSCDDSELKDVKRFLILSGIPVPRMVDSMAKAHIYAKVEGSRLDVKITYLELGRWVQLFHQLLTNGNWPVWSLHISWEHTYLSSLGEAEGKDIVTYAICSYLSIGELYKPESPQGYSLCLPGGWPTPLKLRDYVWYSKEASVKQNCMYLEFWGAWDRSPVEKALSATGSMGSYLLDTKILHIMMFPNYVNEITAHYGGLTENNLALVGKKLMFAANWTVEQATENDIELYLLWFHWFASRLHPFGNFFSSFYDLLKKELKHPIWNCIVRCRRELMSRHELNLESRPIPMLSTELADLFLSSDSPKSSRELLLKAICCVPLLRISFRQWHVESEYDFSEKNSCLVPVLRSLRRVEESLLDILVDSPSFDMLYQIYSDLLEDHISFWKGTMSSEFEMSLISWRSLTKNVGKLHAFCPREVEQFQVEGKNLGRVSSWSLHSQKSLLWVHGGHLFLPYSADLYQKQQQLLNFCELTWPRNTKLRMGALHNRLIEAAVSSIPALRRLAMEAVGMSSYITGEDNDDELNVVQQLEEMYQMLLTRFECERKKLEDAVMSTKRAHPVANLAACCNFPPDLLCRRSGFDSWLDTLPIIDNNSFDLDMELLQELSQIVLVEAEELEPALSNIFDLLKPTLDLSLGLSSRPPTDFLPHRKILWTLDALTSVNAENAKISCYVLETWFSWHSFLWTIQAELAKNIARMDGNAVSLPHMLFQPVRMATVDRLLQTTLPIKDYATFCLKIRAASSTLWQSCPAVTNVQTFLLSTARSLLQQTIYAHRKSFSADKYAAIKSILSSFQKNMATPDNIEVVLSLLTSSSHHGFTSMVHSIIEPLLGELYLQCSSSDRTYKLGCAWLRLGGLRYRLLIAFDDLDPAMKYSCKYLKLVEKVALLQLDKEVRDESAYLAGCLSWGKPGEQRMKFGNLKAECKRLEHKIVFRSNPGKFAKLKYECEEFLQRFGTSNDLIKGVGSVDKQHISNQVYNWQETASCFIDLLSNEYAAYVDVIQPVQVAVYEMKLGLSLLLSSTMQKKVLYGMGQDDMDRVQETIYSFMRFPRGFASEAVSVKINSGVARFPCCDVDFPIDIRRMDMDLLENLSTSATDDRSDQMVSDLQLKLTIHHNVLLRVAHCISEIQLLDNASFALLDKIFDEFASLWMNMKVRVRTKQEHEAQQFKFKPRALKIDSIIESDLSSLVGSLPNETLSEWQDWLLKEEVAVKKSEEEDDALEEEWNLMKDSIMNNMVHVHNQLFGSMDLVHTPRVFKVSEEERLSSFTESYRLGVRMIRRLEGSLSSDLDAKLAPEYLFCLCLEHEQKFNFSHQSAHAYNFYKDPNAPVMAKMVERVIILQERIVFLLNEWDDHPALQKILDAIEMILAIPLSTPLAKALSGLQFLLNRIRVLQETVSKFPLSGELEQIFHLVSSWQKLEFECWPALLDEVQTQFEINAGNLWFPLYAVLQNRHPTDVAVYDRSTIQSLKEFIQTSSVGEFRKRLQLLYAFHGQISTGICRGSYLSPRHMENMKVLYNLFGFYVQYYPKILEYMEDKRKGVEMKLKEFSKLGRWEISPCYVSVEKSKQTRQKVKDLIEKYTGSLQHPILDIINQEAPQRGLKLPSAVDGPHPLNESSDKNREMLKVACDQTLFRDKDRATWFSDWKRKVDCVLQKLLLEKTPEFDLLYSSAVGSTISQFLAAQSTSNVYQEEHKEVWSTIGNICGTAIDSKEIWKDETKSLGKRRALAHLLKLLDGYGLSKHWSTFLEDHLESDQPNQWLMQPSYDTKHVLLTQGGLPSDDSFAATGQLPSFPLECLEREWEWETANRYYFRSIASVHILRHICLNFHKDFTLEQVNRSGSFLDHLIEIQQQQRAAAYGFANQLTRLRKCTEVFENVFSSSLVCDTVAGSECSFAQNQNTTYNCMWQQKHLLGSLCSMLVEECLLLKTVESTHFNTCQSVKGAANRVCVFLEKFIPDFQKSKDLLDNHLLGRDRVLTSVTPPLHPYVVSKQMEQFVLQNFQMIKEFEKQLCAFREQDEDRRSVNEVLLGRFDDILKKASSLEEYYYGHVQSVHNENDTNCRAETVRALEAGFSEAVKETYKHIVEVFHSIGTWNSGDTFSVESLGKITLWKVFFETRVVNLKLDVICDAVVKAIDFAVKLVNDCNESPHLSVHVGAHLKHLHSLVDLVLAFGQNLLHDFLVVHRMVSTITHVLAEIFASLYSQGYGVCNEEAMEESNLDKTQETKGTGMGEGAGQTDVSNQITDEDQLLGDSEKPNDDQADLGDVPSKNDKGIEMERDFAADTFSVSEDSGDNEDEDGEDEQLDSAMGETGADSEIIDEKLWDSKDEEETPKNANEKYESGPSVKDTDSRGRELRAKDESDSATPADEAGETNPNEFDGHDDLDNAENMDDMNLDKGEAFADPTEFNVDEPTGGTEDIEMDDQENAEDAGPDELDESLEIASSGEQKNESVDEFPEKTEDDEQGGNNEKDGMGGTNEEAKEMDLVGPEKHVLNSSTPDKSIDLVPNAESTTQPKGDSHATDLREIAPEAVEAKWSNTSDTQNDLAPMEGLHNAYEVEITVPDSSRRGRISDDQQPQNQLPQHHESSSSQKLLPNPCHNVGDVLEEWKERVKVTVDLQENKLEAPDDVVDEDADEFGYTSEFDKGTAQALGPATSEQTDNNINVDKPDEDGKALDREYLDEMEIENQDSERRPIKTLASNHTEKIKAQVDIQQLEEAPEESQAIYGQYESDRSLSESLVSLKRSYMAEDISQTGQLSLLDREIGTSHNLDEVPGDFNENANVLWRRYELQTTRLSQELAEQLRRVMEPTLASKLQGDYKTGKRINMKKVIPYIASHYRKDKIWLRRTRPNKRDYQVVVALDDSLSMSESHCGDVAVEALVTVCRAMSQLEVGNLAVASFGKKGNIRLLHEFDKPFTGEAGVKMISSLTFKQQNTIEDEPVVDLLKYVNNMLDVAVANARLPSGQNPLQQLVLIIADGRLHENPGNLKRCVRDVLSRKRMVAFLLLDSSQESMMDIPRYSFPGGKMKVTKGLDSFPFPYYIVLRNIEALPRTLADLMRQWFELMQNSRD